MILSLRCENGSIGMFFLCEVLCTFEITKSRLGSFFNDSNDLAFFLYYIFVLFIFFRLLSFFKWAISAKVWLLGSDPIFLLDNLKYLFANISVSSTDLISFDMCEKLGELFLTINYQFLLDKLESFSLKFPVLTSLKLSFSSFAVLKYSEFKFCSV